LKFNAPLDTVPQPVPVNFIPQDSLWYVTQRGTDQESFSINYWILDSMIYKLDTLQVAVGYWKNNDTLPEIIEFQTDTVSLVNKETQQRKQKEAKAKNKKSGKKKDENESDTAQTQKVTPLQMNITPSGSLNPYDVVSVVFGEPVMDVQKDFFVVEKQVDTLWQSVDFEFYEDSTRAMTYIIKRPFKYKETYRITIDSALMCGVYGHCNDHVSATMTVKGEEDYGHLIVETLRLPVAKDSVSLMPAFMELLNSTGMPVRKAQVINGKATFSDMSPDKYYARIILDANGNGIWDAGSYEEKRQPEIVIYFMKQFEIRQNWKIEESWDISASRLGEKPDELLKNKPKDDPKKKRDYRNENKSGSRNNTNSGMGGLGRGLSGINSGSSF
jgi:hypothetical protein